MLDRGRRSIASWLLGPVADVWDDAGAVEELKAGDEADAFGCEVVSG